MLQCFLSDPFIPEPPEGTTASEAALCLLLHRQGDSVAPTSDSAAPGRRRWCQSSLTLCDPLDCSPPGSSVHRIFPGKGTEVGCHALLHGVFSTPGSNPPLLHCRRIFFFFFFLLSELPGKRCDVCSPSPNIQVRTATHGQQPASLLVPAECLLFLLEAYLQSATRLCTNASPGPLLLPPLSLFSPRRLLGS